MDTTLALYVAACVAGGIAGFLLFVKGYELLWKKMFPGLKTPEERVAFQKKGFRYTLLLILATLPLLMILVAFEEIIFRLPLILVFDSLTPGAWIGIGISTLLFGVWHVRNKKALKEFTEKEIAQGTAKIFTTGKPVLDALRAMLPGILFAWIAVSTQSFPLLLLGHAGWNVLVLFEIPQVLIMLVFVVISIPIVLVREGIKSTTKKLKTIQG